VSTLERLHPKRSGICYGLLERAGALTIRISSSKADLAANA
jgi:hypothetical protein